MLNASKIMLQRLAQLYQLVAERAHNSVLRTPKRAPPGHVVLHVAVSTLQSAVGMGILASWHITNEVHLHFHLSILIKFFA
jgi:hypothetical protein